MSRSIPAVNAYDRASKAARTGAFGALAFAAWLGIPAFVNPSQSGRNSPVEIAITLLLVGFALLTMWRLGTRRGWIVGPILLVALVIEAAKRAALVQQFDVFDALVTMTLLVALLTGVRGARALRDMSADNAHGERFG